MARSSRDNRKRLSLGAKIAVFVAAIAVLGAAVYAVTDRVIRLMYPLAYSEQVEAAATENGLPPSLLYATICTESHFKPEAESSAGAMGLMQMTDIAFTEAQKKRDGEVTMTKESLYDPAINICYGGYYLGRMLKRFGTIETALAAYNAGQSRVAGWLKDSAYSKDGKTLSYIPYEETRNYVERVLEAQKIYQALYDIE